jgi:hypothetical protein
MCSYTHLQEYLMQTLGQPNEGKKFPNIQQGLAERVKDGSMEAAVAEGTI